MNYGIDWEGPANDELDSDHLVQVPITECPLVGADYDEFQMLAFQQDTTNYGIDLYEHCVFFY